jgi:glycolate oxidase iron-sulfur subunit
MQTHLADFIRDTPDGEEADAILRKCVHCGFCNATCPTYQLTGDELDGPRGRIYLMKQMLEGEPASHSTLTHLDRCLTCRSCETTCPSGVRYGRLVEIGRRHAQERIPRPPAERMLRSMLARLLPNSGLFAPALRIGQWVRPLLPAALRAKIPARQRVRALPRRTHARRVLLLAGCVQPSMRPAINVATARVFDALGIETLLSPGAGCCGAIGLHLGYQEQALNAARRNIDAWWPQIEAGAEAVIVNASGCGATVREYADLLRHDAQYAARAERISRLALDPAEYLAQFETQLASLPMARPFGALAFQSPCSLQHGMRVRGRVEGLFASLGIDLCIPADAHLCCGSAGTYSVLEPGFAQPLRERKAAALEATGASAVLSANIGCICHLQGGTRLPVMHWIELLDDMLSQR